MLSMVRKRATYANVAVTLALVFALSGGAYAAGRYVITSTKQIKPSVLKQLRGAAGPAGKAGAAGPSGPAGSPGAAGAAGVRGEAGTAGAEGKEGSRGEKGLKGEKGEKGEPWPAGGTLPPEQTETGSWSYSAVAPGYVTAPVSFSIPLAKPLGATEVHFVTETEWFDKTAPADCPGEPEKPEAAPGSFCAYEKANSGNVTLPTGLVVGADLDYPNAGAATAGAVLFFGEAEEQVFAYGTWAVTAPPEP
jgi:hypothetical protein